MTKIYKANSRSARTCPHCGVVGQSRGRFRRRHLVKQLCIAYKKRHDSQGG